MAGLLRWLFGKRRSSGQWAASMGAALLFIFLALAIGSLARQALDQLRALNTANSDNLQWTISQAEVEFLQFYSAVVLAQQKAPAATPTELEAVRRWFDIFYSRMGTLSTGPIYGSLAAQTAIAKEFDRISGFLDEFLPLIDGPDLGLQTALPAIAGKAAFIRRDVRTLSLEGIRVFSDMSDNQRNSVSDTMTRIALLTVSLILLLLLAVFFLERIYRTARRQAQENLATRERLQTMLNTSLDAVLVVDREGRFLEFNGAATEIFGYTEAEALGADMTKLIFPDHLVAAHQQGMRRHLETGETRILGKGRIQVQGKRKSGQVFPVELSLAKTMSPEGEIFVSYLRDISDRMQAEERLTKARDEALAGERAKARFMAVMSHEMRTPLNGLMGSLDLLRGTGLSQKQVEFVEVMQKSGDLLLHHVNDVLDIARLESGRMVGDNVALDLDALVAEVLDSQLALAQAKGLSLTYRPEAGAIGTIMGSAIGLRQVLLNLVNNAIKFTARGLVEVQASIIDLGAGEGVDKRLSLRVRDTGIGIASADLARVFDDFVTLDSSFGRKADGTGLGLGIARRIVQSMGGEIGVVSEVKLGSTFWIDLPYAPPAVATLTARPAEKPALKKAAPARRPAAAKQAAKPAPAPHNPLDILVVEDNQINRFILREMLSSQGHRVTEAVDGLEGVTLAQERRFDLIFMDISMPALDGIAATVRLRSGVGPCAKAPIVALTAHALPDDRALFLASGMNAVLNKPLDRAMLTHVLQELTRAPGAAGRRRARGENSGQATASPALKARRKSVSPAAQAADTIAASNAPSPAHLPLLRASSVEDLKTALGAARLSGLMQRFLEEGERTVPQSATLLAQGKASEAQAALHALAGVAATFGALALQARLSQMESDLKRGDLQAAIAAQGDLGDLWQASRAAISEQLAALAA